ncbi:MAG: YitT family protein [Clostridia bacterium]|nr:YitT family protein [Clostridia bacterium]
MSIKNNLLRHTINVLLVILGNAMVAFGVCYFIIPMDLIMGGVTGLSLAMNHYFGIDIAVTAYIINIFFFFVGLIFIGKKFAVGIVISTLAYPTFLAIFKSIPGLSYAGEEKMLGIIFAALLVGAGGGLILRNGASSGGLEVLASVLNARFGISIALIVNFEDVLILFAQLPYSSIDSILYGLLITFVLALVLDKVLMIGQSKTQVVVVSNEWKKIREMILHDQDMGCTLLHATSGFANEETNAVMCVLSNRKLFKLHEAILDIDERAFIITSEVTNVKGRGFTIPKIWASRE